MRLKFLFLAFGLMMGVLESNSQTITRCKVGELKEIINSKADGILIINFWATFCKPCVAELPHFIEVAKKMKDAQVRLLLVSVDAKDMYSGKLKSFIRKHHYDTENKWLDETDANYFCPEIDASWGGSIPATLFVNMKTGKRVFVESELSESQLREKISMIKSE